LCLDSLKKVNFDIALPDINLIMKAGHFRDQVCSSCELSIYGGFLVNMINKKTRLLTLSLFLLAATATLNANTVTIGANGPNTVGVFSVISAALDGAGMAGLLSVQVIFANGSSNSFIWAADCGAGCGSAHNTAGTGGWTLTETGSTDTIIGLNPNTSAISTWTLRNSSTDANFAISSVVLNGGGNIVFDRSPFNDLQIGTPGSDYGVNFNVANTVDTGRTISVTYDNKILITGSPSTACSGAGYAGLNTGVTGCGDVFGKLTFSFSGGPSFIGTTTTPIAAFNFFTDTDLVGSPEPVTFVLAGAGLAAILAFRKRFAR